MITIAVANHKGGTGKTTTVLNLAQWLACERPVLAIDLDPQGNLTRALGGAIDHRNSIGDVMRGRAQVTKAVQVCDSIHLVGADIRLEETAAAMQAASPNHTFLRRCLHNGRAGYNWPWWICLIDCPPAANILTINALCAADYVVIPADPEPDAISGLRRIVELAAWLRDEVGMGAVVLGSVLTRVNGQTLRHQEALNTLTARSMPRVLATVPLRQGVDAQSQIADAYLVAADAIRKAVALC